MHGPAHAPTREGAGLVSCEPKQVARCRRTGLLAETSDHREIGLATIVGEAQAVGGRHWVLGPRLPQHNNTVGTKTWQIENSDDRLCTYRIALLHGPTVLKWYDQPCPGRFRGILAEERWWWRKQLWLWSTKCTPSASKRRVNAIYNEHASSHFCLLRLQARQEEVKLK